MFQKAVELNANLIIPYCFQKSLTKINNQNYLQKLKRYQKIVKEAGEQSQRNHKVRIVNHLINKSEIKNYLLTNNFICDLKGKPFSFQKTKNNQDTLIIIGPREGFSKEERLFFKSLNFQFVQLSKTVLRTETAFISALAICNYLLNLKITT